MIKKLALGLMIILCTYAVFTINVHAQDAQTLVEVSFNYVRGKTSMSLVAMKIHRPDWERNMSLKAWTKGQDESLVRIIAPPKDNGNGTLKKGREMWMYNPKVNRVIKVPPSMMSQGWMGSDFSNNDLAKSDSLLNDYIHTTISTEIHDGVKVYVIKSMPKPAAPVIWGMQRLKIREDAIFLEQKFFDEDLEPVKILTTHSIQMLGGKLFPRVWKMQKADVDNEYTQLDYKEIVFDVTLPNNMFTLSSLRTPRR